MGAIISACVSSITLGLGWCLCSAAGSICNSCLGDDDPSSSPTVTSGRKRSVFLLVLSIGLAFLFKYCIAPALSSHGSAIAHLPTVGNHLVHSWNDGCSEYDSDDARQKCSGNAGVFRASACALLFFALSAVAAKFKPTANREAWPAKYVLFLFAAGFTVFIPNRPIFLGVYLQIARIGAMIFISLQQVILIDVAYNWNDSWVTKANDAELEERRSGQKWLAGILSSCCVLFMGSLIVIILLFVYFSGCASNELFISVTLILSVTITVVQLCSEEGSLLSSSVITAYATYLVMTAVTKNPNEECNPWLGENDVIGIILGIGLTVLSLAWTGWSYTADKSLSSSSGRNTSGEMSFPLVESSHATRTSRSDSTDYGDFYTGSFDNTDSDDESSMVFYSWKLNIILALISCWFSMAITGWGSIQSGGREANPEVSSVSMWMIISSQWFVMGLYLWTLVAPKIFSDRDFS